MTEDLMLALAAQIGPNRPRSPVHATGGDYAYDGWLVSTFQKRGGAWRCVVEDANGRLFIHNARNLSEPGEDWKP